MSTRVRDLPGSLGGVAAPGAASSKGRRLVTAVALTSVLTGGIAPVASAEVIPVDPGAKISAGKEIIGSGQNLPSIQALEIYDVGPGPADQINRYYSSGSVERDQRQVASAALTWTKRWLRKTCGGLKPSTVRNCQAAAVFDIDDTLLSSYPTLSTNEPAFSWDSATSEASVNNCTKPVIQATRNLFTALKKLGVTPMLITGRSDSQREATIRCLEEVGISGWGSLVMRAADNRLPASVYKSRARRNLERQGWKIGPSTGDQVSDMSYGHLGRGFLLPNPMYFIP